MKKFLIPLYIVLIIVAQLILIIGDFAGGLKFYYLEIQFTNINEKNYSYHVYDSDSKLITDPHIIKIHKDNLVIEPSIPGHTLEYTITISSDENDVVSFNASTDGISAYSYDMSTHELTKSQKTHLTYNEKKEIIFDIIPHIIQVISLIALAICIIDIIIKKSKKIKITNFMFF